MNNEPLGIGNGDPSQSEELPRPANPVETAREEVRTAKEILEEMSRQATELERLYPGLGISQLLSPALEQVQKSISAKIRADLLLSAHESAADSVVDPIEQGVQQESNAAPRAKGQVPAPELYAFWERALAENHHVPTINMHLQDFARKGHVFRHEDEAISAEAVKNFVYEAKAAAERSQQDLEDVLAEIPDYLSFKKGIAETFRACQVEIQRLKSKDSSIAEILQALDILTQNGWEFVMKVGELVKVRQPQVIAEAVRKAQAAAGNPSEFYRVVSEVTSLYDLRSKVILEVQERWTTIQKITNRVPDRYKSDLKAYQAQPVK